MNRIRTANLWRRMAYGLIAGLLLGIGALAILLLEARLFPVAAPSQQMHHHPASADFDGIVPLEPPLPIADFTLKNQYGQATNLSDLRGRYVLLTFGFTHCPDVCPLTLSDFWQLRQMLGAAADKLHFVFISVDGQRDSPAVLREYLASRQLHGFIALTGAEAALRALGQPFGLDFEISAAASPDDYRVNHTVGAFLLDRQNRWLRRYRFGTAPSAMAADIQALLAA